jgi:hypothetical protein
VECAVCMCVNVCVCACVYTKEKNPIFWRGKVHFNKYRYSLSHATSPQLFYGSTLKNFLIIWIYSNACCFCLTTGLIIQHPL